MDLNFYYQDIVRACFPNAQIVIDRFPYDPNAYPIIQFVESPGHEDLRQEITAISAA